MRGMNAAPRLLHAMRLPVRWGDMDALGHVNNAEYLRYFEQARIQWLEAIGIRVDGRGEGPILLKASVTWLKPVVYPCEIEVRQFAGRIGNTSFTVMAEIVNGRDAAERFTEGEFVIVWVDYATGRPVPVPDFVRQKLGTTA